MNDDTKYCSRCQTVKPIGDFYVNRGRRDGLSTYCTICYGEYSTASRQAVREELRALLGTVCQRCGFGDERALQIDHVFGGGRQERLSGGGTQTRAFLNRVKADRDRYQLLCANCNQIKKYENGELGGNPRVRETPQRLTGARQLPDGSWRGTGKGNAPAQKEALARARTPEHQAAAGRANKGRPNPRLSEAKLGTRLVLIEGKRRFVRPE